MNKLNLIKSLTFFITIINLLAIASFLTSNMNLVNNIWLKMFGIFTLFNKDFFIGGGAFSVLLSYLTLSYIVFIIILSIILFDNTDNLKFNYLKKHNKIFYGFILGNLAFTFEGFFTYLAVIVLNYHERAFAKDFVFLYVLFWLLGILIVLFLNSQNKLPSILDKITVYKNKKTM